MIKLNFKRKLFEHLLEKIEDKIDEFVLMQKRIAEDKNSETKSVVGDKFETSRSMMQREQDQLLDRLKNLHLQRTQLLHFRNETRCQVVEPGSLLQTHQGIFYISIPFGKTQLDGINVFCMSPDAPLGKLLLGEKKGENVNFNAKEIEIEDLC